MLNNLDLAYELHEAVTALGFDFSSLSPEAQRIILELGNDRIKLLEKAIELCFDNQSPEAYLIIGTSYFFLGAKYRKQAIHYLKKYLYEPSWTPCLESYRNNYIASVWTNLGKSYEGEYLWNESIDAYNHARLLTPHYPSAYVKIANIMRKKNQLNLAIEFLDAVKRTEYYTHPLEYSHFDTVINSCYTDLRKKLDNGYVYKTRSKKVE